MTLLEAIKEKTLQQEFEKLQKEWEKLIRWKVQFDEEWPKKQQEAQQLFQRQQQEKRQLLQWWQAAQPLLQQEQREKQIEWTQKAWNFLCDAHEQEQETQKEKFNQYKQEATKKLERKQEIESLCSRVCNQAEDLLQKQPELSSVTTPPIVTAALPTTTTIKTENLVSALQEVHLDVSPTKNDEKENTIYPAIVMPPPYQQARQKNKEESDNDDKKKILENNSDTFRNSK